MRHPCVIGSELDPRPMTWARSGGAPYTRIGFGARSISFPLSAIDISCVITIRIAGNHSPRNVQKQRVLGPCYSGVQLRRHYAQEIPGRLFYRTRTTAGQLSRENSVEQRTATTIFYRWLHSTPASISQAMKIVTRPVHGASTPSPPPKKRGCVRTTKASNARVRPARHTPR